MTSLARREYMRDMQVRYQRAESRKEKSRIILEAVEMLGCHRKHAIRRLNGPDISVRQPFRIREPLYPERLIRVLECVWEASQYLWSERLKEALPLWLPWIKKRLKLTYEEERQLLSISPSTIDRRLAPYKQKAGRRIYGKTKPGRFLRQRIPIQTES
ncbi:MAG: integrase, partial [Nitrospirota bacterium]